MNYDRTRHCMVHYYWNKTDSCVNVRSCGVTMLLTFNRSPLCSVVAVTSFIYNVKCLAQCSWYDPERETP